MTWEPTCQVLPLPRSRGHPRGTLVSLFYPRDQPKNTEPMLWQAEAGMRFRMPGGDVLDRTNGAPIGRTGGSSDALTKRLSGWRRASRSTPSIRPSSPRCARCSSTGTRRRRRCRPDAGEAEAVRLFTRIYGRSPRDIAGVISRFRGAAQGIDDLGPPRDGSPPRTGTDPRRRELRADPSSPRSLMTSSAQRCSPGRSRSGRPAPACRRGSPARAHIRGAGAPRAAPVSRRPRRRRGGSASGRG